MSQFNEMKQIQKPTKNHDEKYPKTNGKIIVVKYLSLKRKCISLNVESKYIYGNNKKKIIILIKKWSYKIESERQVSYWTKLLKYETLLKFRVE